MTIVKFAAIAAVALAATSTTAVADHSKKGCDKHLCYTPYKPYTEGNYSYLVCADKNDRLTYVEHKSFWGKKKHRLKCVPR